MEASPVFGIEATFRGFINMLCDDRRKLHRPSDHAVGLHYFWRRHLLRVRLHRWTQPDLCKRSTGNFFQSQSSWQLMGGGLTDADFCLLQSVTLYADVNGRQFPVTRGQDVGKYQVRWYLDVTLCRSKWTVSQFVSIGLLCSGFLESSSQTGQLWNIPGQILWWGVLQRPAEGLFDV